MQNVVIVGATSAMAEAVARQYAKRGATLYLAARNVTRLSAIADDLRVRGAAAVHIAEFRAENREGHGPLVNDAWQRLGRVDIALIAHGVLPDQAACEASTETAIASLEVNAISAASLLGCLADRFQAQRSGTIGVISSVAGDRGRKSNYVYGAAKALVDAYASGLRHRLHAHNVQVTLIKPGFVDTPMTAHFSKGLLWASSETAGRLIVRALDRRASTVYVPWFWRWIMLVVKSLPEWVFVRTGL